MFLSGAGLVDSVKFGMPNHQIVRRSWYEIHQPLEAWNLDLGANLQVLLP